jgi:hypothetical protein
LLAPAHAYKRNDGIIISSNAMCMDMTLNFGARGRMQERRQRPARVIITLLNEYSSWNPQLAHCSIKPDFV